MRALSQKKKWLWIFQAALIFSIIGSSIATAFYLLLSESILAVMVPLSLGILGFFYGLLRYRNWGFEVKEDHLYIEHGVVKKVYSMVPHVRIQHIDTDRGPIDRVFGLSTLRVYTAGSRGADIKIPGLERKEAHMIQKKLRDVAIESEKGYDAV